MSGIQRPASLEALNTQLFKTFQAAMLAPRFAGTSGMFTTMPSSTEFNTYAWLAKTPGMHEWLGPRMVEGVKERAYTIYNKHYEKSFAVNIDRLNDGQIADASFMMSELADAAATLADDLLLDLVENGATRLCYDGQYFYDTDHPTDLDGTGSQRNYYASGLSFDATNLKSAIATMEQFQGESGRPLGIGQNGLTLLVPSGLWGSAMDAVEAKTVTNGGENTLVTKYNVTPVKWTRLTSATRWFLFDLRSSGPGPFIRQVRQAPKYVSKTAPNDDNVFDRNENVYGVDSREGAGYGIWSKAFSAAA